MREEALERDRPLLEREGYEAADGTLAFFEQAVGANGATPDIAVRRTTDRGAWVRLVTTAFAEGGVPDETSRRSADLCAAAAASLFVAEIDGAAAGGAALGVAGEFAFLYCGGVLPQYRRRGVHGALLRARLADARARGIARAMIKVAPDSAGERNVRRAGFEPTLVLRRANRTEDAT